MTELELTQSMGDTPVDAYATDALPIVAVAGLRGKSTIVWLLEAMLAAAGRSTGVWCSTGVYIQGMRQAGELGPWSRVMEAVRVGTLDIAVQELETPMVTTVGLPQGIYPVAAISTLCGNNEDCLISPEASLGMAARGVVARAVRPDGTLVLNADDQAVLDAIEETPANVVLFALHPDNPALRRHLQEGGSGVWLDDGHVVIGDDLDQRQLVSVEDAHFTLDGALIFQVQNLLCTIALAAALNVPDRIIRQEVATFQPDPARLPGSCNIIRVAGATVVIDAARQVWTLRSLVRGVRHQPHRRTIVVSGCFPHLEDGQIVEAGRLLGRLEGAVILHAEEIHRPLIDLMIDGIAQNEVPPLVLSMPGERLAIQHALKMLSNGDICLLLTDDVPNALAVIDHCQS